MAIASSIRPYLPHLRRFARTLTGDQRVGDAYVASLLELLIADPTQFNLALTTRAALYQLLLKRWNSVRIDRIDDLPDDGDIAVAQRRLDSMTSLPRQAFLLVAVEGFTRADAAGILEVAEENVGSLLNAASREIAHQIATDVLIIEDELLIAMDLEDIVSSLGHRVVEIATTQDEAIASYTANRPGLVLADIKLADGSSGLNAARAIAGQGNVPIIFITAYPERVLSGERPEPTFLLSKPFQRETVMAMISQALFFEATAKASAEEAFH